MVTMNPMRTKGVFASAALLFFAAGGLAWGQQTVEVVVQGYQFQPQELRIRAGDTVKWVNREKRTSHSVMLPADQGGESERFFPDESWEHRFDQPGRYPYHCGPHPEMTGLIEVVDR